MTQSTGRAEYEYQGKTVVESTTIDLQPFKKSAKPIEPIVERLDKMNEHLTGIREALARSDG